MLYNRKISRPIPNIIVPISKINIDELFNYKLLLRVVLLPKTLFVTTLLALGIERCESLIIAG